MLLKGSVYCPSTLLQDFTVMYMLEYAPLEILRQMERISLRMIQDMVDGKVGGSLFMVRCTQSNAYEDTETGACVLGDALTERKLSVKAAIPFARVMSVLAAVHRLLRLGQKVAQRELYYMLVHVFSNQRELNRALLNVSATLGVPRFALNIGAATRGVVAGCIKIAPATSPALVDCEYVGPVR
jgi:DNA topoisomerase VI subunit A